MTYALIQWGGLVAGQRPRSALAYIWESDRGWKAELLNPDGTTRYKRPRSIIAEDILFRFLGRRVPDAPHVAAAKRSLPIVELNDSRFDIQESINA